LTSPAVCGSSTPLRLITPTRTLATPPWFRKEQGTRTGGVNGMTCQSMTT